MTEDEIREKHNTSQKKWYDKVKDDPEFKKKRNARQREYMKELKKNNPDKYYGYRYKHKNIYYQRGRQEDINSTSRYTNAEIEMIMEHKIPDREIAKKLGRSIQAIQVVRSKVKNGYY